mgnify:CR=1 FL=1
MVRYTNRHIYFFSSHSTLHLLFSFSLLDDLYIFAVFFRIFYPFCPQLYDIPFDPINQVFIKLFLIIFLLPCFCTISPVLAGIFRHFIVCIAISVSSFPPFSFLNHRKYILSNPFCSIFIK